MVGMEKRQEADGFVIIDVWCHATCFKSKWMMLECYIIHPLKGMEDKTVRKRCLWGPRCHSVIPLEIHVEVIHGFYEFWGVLSFGKYLVFDMSQHYA